MESATTTMERETKPDPCMDIPLYFRCPISMKVIKDPVTISTGVTYERKNIEKWLFTYKKKTCPATMQALECFDLTPNHTLKRLILAWQDRKSQCSSSSSSSASSISSNHDELVSLLATMDSTPFKVSSLKKLRVLIEMGDDIKLDFVKSGGIEALIRIIVQILIECCDFITFRACEEALGVLYQLPLSKHAPIDSLSKPECMKSLAIMLQRGSTEARLHTITIFQNMAKLECNWNWVVDDQGMDLFKSLLELLSDEIGNKASSSTLDVLIEILKSSKKNRLKAIESGAICVLIELLPDSNRPKCEKMLLLIKLLCECAEGRLALVEHALGIASVSKKILRVSDTATKIGIKIFWLITSFHPTEKVLEDMLIFGTVRKLVALLHIDHQSSTKDRALKILKLHGNAWRQYPCFPNELKNYLGLMNGSH